MGKRFVRVGADVVVKSLEDVFNPKTGQYYVPYNPVAEESIYRPTKGLAEDISIAVLDTGVLTDHPGLKGRVVNSADFTGEGPEDRNGHGTVVALLAAGPFLPGPKILNVKVLDKDGNGFEEHIAAGMMWAADNGAVLLNMSLGISRDCDGSCLLCSTASSLLQFGVLVFAAAGNDGPGIKCCPAQSESVVSVGALDYEGKEVEDYSGKGNLYMPGSFDMVPFSQSEQPGRG